MCVTEWACRFCHAECFAKLTLSPIMFLLTDSKGWLNWQSSRKRQTAQFAWWCNESEKQPLLFWIQICTDRHIRTRVKNKFLCLFRVARSQQKGCSPHGSQGSRSLWISCFQYLLYTFYHHLATINNTPSLSLSYNRIGFVPHRYTVFSFSFPFVCYNLRL